MTVTLWSGSIPVDAKDIVESRVERIARRAQRQGFPVPTIRYDGEYSVKVDELTSVDYVSLDIIADGALRLGDWEFVGTVSELEGGEPFVTYAPGVERVDNTFATVNYCDHCQTVRYRNDTYIVRNDEGVTKQVGSTCIKDFTGHSPAAIVGWLSAVDSISFSEDEVSGWGRSATRFYDPASIIGIASRIVSKAGYVSKQKAMDEDRAATGELVRSWLTARTTELRKFEEAYPADDEALALEEATMQAIVTGTATSDWMADIIRLAKATGVQWRHVGILGSAVILGLRTQEDKVVREQRGESNFIGTKGERITLTDVRVTLKRGYENAYGQGYVIRMSHGDNDLLWFGSGYAAESVEEGDVITLTATVKNHELDKRSERPTTVVNRPVITKE